MRTTAVLTVLFAAAVCDARTRKVPNAFPVMIALCCLIPPVRICPAGLLAALPFLVAGVACGGIGGGDVKIAAALGLAVGLLRTASGVGIALALLIIFHGVMKLAGKGSTAYPLVPFLFAGMTVCLAFTC